jgi:hypothetical protein
VVLVVVEIVSVAVVDLVVAVAVVAVAVVKIVVAIRTRQRATVRDRKVVSEMPHPQNESL